MHTHDPYLFCPKCAAPLSVPDQSAEPRLTCPNCGWVHYEDPKVAVGVLLMRGDEVLLVRRVMEPYQGSWSIPAGFMNAYEDPAAAALRECQEETGLTVELEGLFDVLTGREHPRGSDLLLVYKASQISGALAAGDDADQAAWFPLDALPPLAFTSTRTILDKVRSLTA